MLWLHQGLILCLGVAVSMAIPREVLYPFGTEHGDHRLDVGDDTSSPEIQLRVPIVFYDEPYRGIYVNLNGLLSFETEFTLYRSDLVIPFRYKVIAPFFANVDTRLSGNVYYRETQDPSLLEMASKEIHPNFPRRRNFRPRSLLVVTWDDVGYFEKQFDRTNTFQVVIASDGVDSFVMMLYPEIHWIRSQGKDGIQDVPAQAGFDSGNHLSYLLPGSGNDHVMQISQESNTAVPGVWMFRVGNLERQNIEDSAGHTDVGLGGGNAVAGSCATGGDRLCSVNGMCEDFASGYCCACQSSFVGNGMVCVTPDIQMRVNGRVSGTINGHSLTDSNLHAFLMFKDGRTYVAISRVVRELGHSLQSLYAFASGLGWLLALPAVPTAKNGFMITGGNMNRSATIRFVDTGETIQLEEQYRGQNAEGHMELNAVVNGNVPRISEQAEIVVPDYKEEYRRVGPGQVKSYATHTFTVDDVPVHFTVDQTIRYEECEHRPSDGDSVQRLSVSRTFIHFDDNEQQIVRFSQSNKLAAIVDADPCREASYVCDTNADCVPHRDSFRCMCKDGYTGDGTRCGDVDECSVNTHDCHQRAHCYNNEGSYECRCQDGYTGDGRDCRQEQPEVGGCETLQCDRNAYCSFDDFQGRYTCKCNSGYEGDGYACHRSRDCSVYNYCDRNARCQPGPSGAYECACNEGYEGDGARCHEASCNVINNCDINADCLYDPHAQTYQCRCRQGYQGDGFSCRLTADCRRDPGICDAHARCENRGYDYICICEPGFRGDGYRCAPLGDSESYLLLAQGMTILQMPFHPTPENPGKPVLSIPGQTAIGVDVDCFARYFYWTDVSGQAISRAQLDGTDSQVLVQGVGSPEGIAVDWITGNMYWTDSVQERIEVAKTDGTGRKTLITTDLHDPRGIVVDPASGTMFWSDWHRDGAKIERANMDGNDRKILVGEDVGLPNGLTIDFQTHHICWVDADTSRIECVNYEGFGRQVIYTEADYPFDIAYTSNVFYWTDWHKNTLQSINRFANEPNEGLDVPLGGHGRLYGITVVRSQCPAGTNACALNNGGCRFLCLPTPNGGRTCTCPDDIDPDECNRIGLLL